MVHRKRFGQHFLRDPQVIHQIITAIAPQVEQRILEIGPGQGALTQPLLQYVDQLEVIELDRDLAHKLKAFEPRLKIYQTDVLKFDFTEIITELQPLRIVGNLPYNISTPLLFHLLSIAPHIEDMILMLQKEVVDRMVASPATPAYGRLSVMLHYHYQIDKLFDVPPAAFSPPPQVNSSVVQLIPHLTPPVHVDNLEHFAYIVVQAFSKRRKTLQNALKGCLDTERIVAAGINPHCRAETLTLAEFAQLANVLTN